MRRTATCLMSVVLMIGALTSASAKGPFGSIRVGEWKGGAYTDDRTGAFSHCAAGVSYRNGIVLVLSQNINKTWSIGFASPAFELSDGQTFPIDLTFDGQFQVHLFGVVVTHNMVTAVVPSSTLNALRKSQLMVMRVGSATQQFDLASTGPLIPTIANCVTQTRSLGIRRVGDFSLAVANSSGAPAPVIENKTPAKTSLQNGTGFVISAKGDVVTNYHVIENCVGDISGNLTGEPATTVRIVASDKLNDLALLQTPKPPGAFAKVRSTAVKSGDQVTAIGFPYHGLLTSDFTVTTGIVSSLSGLLNDTRYLQISAPVQPGNSGGPLLDTSGFVVGVVSAKINALKFAKATGDIPENINFAVKTGALRDFLDNSAIQYETAEPKSELKTAEVAQSARAYTMLISCQAKEKN